MCIKKSKSNKLDENFMLLNIFLTTKTITTRSNNIVLNLTLIVKALKISLMKAINPQKLLYLLLFIYEFHLF